MIDLRLTEFFGILGVGIFVVITLVYFFFLAQKLFNIKRHNKNAFYSWLKNALQGEYKDKGYAVVSALIVYSAGILTQDVTDHMTDSERNFNPLISFVQDVNLLDREGELRKAVLIESKTKLTGLGREVFGNARKILAIDSSKPMSFFDNGSPSRDYWEINGPRILTDEAEKKNLGGFINGLYYTSKNWCYLKSDPVRKELDAIQERIDFSRSICIISFLAALGIVLFYLLYYFNELFKKKSSRFKVVIHTVTGRRDVQMKIFHPLKALLVLLVILYVSRVCYTAAEKNFNERAMGYYVSQMKYHDSNE